MIPREARAVARAAAQDPREPTARMTTTQRCQITVSVVLKIVMMTVMNVKNAALMMMAGMDTVFPKANVRAPPFLNSRRLKHQVRQQNLRLVL
jgi:hypothetical protein